MHVLCVCVQCVAKMYIINYKQHIFNIPNGVHIPSMISTEKGNLHYIEAGIDNQLDRT